MASWQPAPSPYNDNPEHRPPPAELGGQHPYPPHQPYHPPPPSREGSGYAVDPAYSRQGSISAPVRSPADPHPRYPPASSTSHDPNYYPQGGLSDYHRPPGPYGAPDQQPNGTHPALHLQTGPEMMPGQPGASHPPPPHGYGPPPHSAGYPPTPGGYPYYDQHARRKPVRAAQACDSCRQRKAKCDEGRPECQHCKDNGLKCSYREIPQPKSEKQVLAITEELKQLSNNMELLIANQKRQEDKLQTVLDMQSGFQGMSQLHDRDERSAASTVRPTLQHQQSEDTQTQAANQAHANSLLRHHQQGRREQQEDDPGLKFSMPLKHTTAVHNLFDWPTIRNLIPQHQSTSYVMDTEMSRGLLRLYGCGEGEDKHDGHEGVPSPSGSSSSGRMDDETSSSSPQQGVWGSGQLPMPPMSDDRHVQEHPGGLSPRGGLMLDSFAIDRYFRSYMENMHILHPFLEPKVLRNMIQVFKRKYSWDRIQPAVTVSGKRKREATESPNVFEESGATSKAGKSTDRSINATSSVIEHSVANAIILLVLALGKVCAHKEQLPGAVAFSSIRTSTPHDHETSDFKTAPSLSAPSSPFGQHLLNGNSGPMAVSSPANPLGKNMDKIPGLSYFAKAADILGELPGGVEVSHIQANLLAGLYMGQLARIFPSHYYISVACRACQVMIESTAYQTAPDQAGAMKPSRRNLINFAFWSCLQLESDILAEVELPPSGITRYEGRQYKEMPTGVTLESIPESDGQEDILRFFSYQVQLRRTMNDAHSMLYKMGPPENKLQKPSLNILDILNDNADSWRGMLNDWDWDDDDHQSTNINVARMRAKYYGAKYIINRPALHYLLRVVGVQPPTPNIKQSDSPQAQSGSPAGRARRSSGMPPPGRTADIVLEADILPHARKCVDAAIRSTTAFDAISGRLIITNVFGTLHAQFGNMLVLSATFTCQHPDLSSFISGDKLRQLFHRTIAILHRHAEISPVLAKDVRILEHVRDRVFPGQYPATSMTSSFSSR